MSNPVTFTTSGTVQAQDGIYLTRKADEDLFRLCQAGEYAYLLTSRQMGKSSLMVATAKWLQDEGVKTAIVDLQRLGAQTTTVDQWYLGVLTAIARRLQIQSQLMTFWEASQSLGQSNRMVQFLEEIVLPQVSEQLVIFVDEIDSTLSLDFTDDFFIALRYCFTARSENPAFRRLSFVLIGVATPSELIADQKRTPFNIGTLVELQDFTATEASPLAAGLGLSAAMSQQVLDWILWWTGGHPYLTQRVCEAVVQQPQMEWSKTAVTELIEQLFFGKQRQQDNNLDFVNKMLVGRAPDKDVLGVLKTYRTIRTGRRPILDEDQSILKSHLKLSGIVKRVGAMLQVRNPIYWEAFNRQWIQEQWPETWWERLKPAMPLISGLAVGVLTLGVLSIYALDQQGKASAEADRAAKAAQEAEIARAAEEEQRQQVEAALRQAEAERERAVKAEQAAEQALKDAQTAEADALEQQDLANAARVIVEEQRFQAEIVREAEAVQRRRAEIGENEALEQTEIARMQARIAAVAEMEAQDQQQIAVSRQLAAQARWVQQQRLDLLPQSVLLATEAIKRLKGYPVSKADAMQLLYALKLLPQEKVSITHGEKVEDVYFNSDGRYSAIFSRNAVRVLDVTTNTEKALIESEETEVFSAADFSPNGQQIVISSGGFLEDAEDTSGKTAQVWDIADNTEVARVEHESAVGDVRFSPDGHYIATASKDGTARVWNVATSTEVARAKHESAVRDVRFSPDGRYIATASEGGTTKVWDIANNTEVSRVEHKSTVRDVRFSPDGRYIATASEDRTARVWDIDNDTEVAYIEHNDYVSSISFSPDSAYVVTDTSQSTDTPYGLNTQYATAYDIEGINWSPLVSNGGKVWNLETNTEALSIPFGGVQPKFSPSGRYLLRRGDGRYTAEVWDISSASVAAYIEHKGDILDAEFSSNSRYVITASSDRTAQVWDLMIGREISRIKHDGDINSVRVSQDSQYVVTGSYDKTAQIVKIVDDAGVVYSAHRGSIRHMHFGPDSRHWVASSRDGTIRILDIVDNTEKAHAQYEGNISDVKVSPDGDFIAAGSYGKVAFVADVRNDVELARIQHSERITAIQLSSDVRYILIEGTNKTRLWDINSKTELAYFQHGQGIVESTTLSYDGRYFAILTSGNEILLLDTDSKREIARFGLEENVKGLYFSPDSQYLAFKDASKVYFWDIANSTKVAIIDYLADTIVSLPVERFRSPGQNAGLSFSPNSRYATIKDSSDTVSVLDIAANAQVMSIQSTDQRRLHFSPDSQYVANVTDENIVVVWSIATDTEVARLQHEGQLNDVRFSPNSRYIAISSGNTVRIWDFLLGIEVNRIAYTEDIKEIRFSPNNQYLLTRSNNVAEAWALNPDELINAACNRFSHNLTVQEWKRFVGDEPYQRTCENLDYPDDYEQVQGRISLFVDTLTTHISNILSLNPYY